MSICGYGTMPVSTAATAMYSTVQSSSEVDDADRHVALRVARLLGVGRDRVEADVGEEDVAGAARHAAEAVRHERAASSLGST